MLSDANNPEPIDAVITWVDGADPRHREKLEAYLSQIGGQRPPSADPARFNDAGELDYCVVSLLRFAPWLRTIFIVTDQQTPGLMQKITGTGYENRIKIVDHLQIFRGYEDCLPTFNSNSIVAMLWRIPGLSEKFLFLNDDFFLIRAVTANDFFRGNKVVLRGGFYSFSDKGWYRKLVKTIKSFFVSTKKNNRPRRVSFLAGQELSAKLIGYTDRSFRLPHNPHPWKVSTMASFFLTKPDILKDTIRFRLRASEQFIGESLAAHLELSRGMAVVDNTFKTLIIKPNSRFIIKLKFRLMLADWSARYAFGCVQSLERGSRENQAIVVNWLRKRIGDPDMFWKNNRYDAVNLSNKAKNSDIL